MTSVSDSIRRSLVGLRMPRALEILDHVLRRVERGEATAAVEAIDELLLEEHSSREGRRITVALRTARLLPVKTAKSGDT